MLDKKWNVLFIKDESSMFDLHTPALSELFDSVDIVTGREDALDSFNAHEYDIVIGDLSENPEELAFLKKLKDIKPKQQIFAMVSPKDTDKLYGIADLGIHAFELTPSYFELALEQIALFNPYEV